MQIITDYDAMNWHLISKAIREAPHSISCALATFQKAATLTPITLVESAFIDKGAIMENIKWLFASFMLATWLLFGLWISL